MVSKNSLMDQDTLEIGKTIKQMVKVSYTMLKGIYMKGIGRMTRLMEKEYISTQMVQNMREIG